MKKLVQEVRICRGLFTKKEQWRLKPGALRFSNFVLFLENIVIGVFGRMFGLS
jgi:hypothetical protein